MMGIGMDCIEVERIAKRLADSAFLEHVFSEKEQAELAVKQKGVKFQSAAAAFAAKEAFAKALGTGLFLYPLTEVALLHRKNGKPYLSFSGKAAQMMQKQGLFAHVTLTHTGALAMATVVLEKGAKPQTKK